MKNGWIETPKDFKKLPWNILAGKRCLWWVELPVCGEYPAKSFAVIGSLKEEIGRQVIEDKEQWGMGGYFYDNVTAYKDIGKGPNDE